MKTFQLINSIEKRIEMQLEQFGIKLHLNCLLLMWMWLL